MDEGTKVLIGTISGFIIAFLAEPIKSLWDNWVKLRNMREALYKELLYNYFWINTLIDTPEFEASTEAVIRLWSTHVKTDYYRYATDRSQGQLALFYELQEYESFHELFAVLDIMPESKSPDALRTMCNRFLSSIAIDLVSGKKLDKKLIRKLTSTEDYLKIIRRGEALTK